MYGHTIRQKSTGSSFVAKRLFTVGHGRPASPEDNASELEKEAVTLLMGQYFLGEFYNRAAATDTAVSDSMLPRFVIICHAHE